MLPVKPVLSFNICIFFGKQWVVAYISFFMDQRKYVSLNLKDFVKVNEIHLVYLIAISNYV